MNRLSKVFMPVNLLQKNVVVKNNDLSSKSQKLMVDVGLIRSSGHGLFHILPMLQKSVEKCTDLIDHYMDKVSAQKMALPNLTPKALWKKTGRLSAEVFLVKDRDEKAFVLAPTHEEAVTDLLGSVGQISHRNYPLRLYQIGNKFRDELRPRFGLMRAREFLMKDLYTFDTDKEKSLQTYEEVNEVYGKLLKSVGVPFLKVEADTGDMGGSLSHEYQYPAAIGDNVLLTCSGCDFAASTDISGDIETCPKCQSNTLTKVKGIEVAHAFQLDDKYTKVFLQKNKNPENLQMGCYGIGVTRLIAAGIEVLCSENEVRWPFLLAPYSVCIIQPKDGSKEHSLVQHYVEIVYGHLTGIDQLKNNVIVDDRNTLTIGQRLLEAKRFGYPLIIVIGHKAKDPNNPIFELHFTKDVNIQDNTCRELPLADLIKETSDYVKQNTILY